jgi:hypothetical protein
VGEAVTGWQLSITADAEVVTVERKLNALRALCASRQTEVDGIATDSDAIWPSEILRILDGGAL